MFNACVRAALLCVLIKLKLQYVCSMCNEWGRAWPGRAMYNIMGMPLIVDSTGTSNIDHSTWLRTNDEHIGFMWPAWSRRQTIIAHIFLSFPLSSCSLLSFFSPSPCPSISLSFCHRFALHDCMMRSTAHCTHAHLWIVNYYLLLFVRFIIHLACTSNLKCTEQI